MTNSSNKVLLIAPAYASVPKSGGGQRTQLLFEALKQRFAVDVVAVGGGYEGSVEEAYDGAGALYYGVNRQPGETPPFSFFRRWNSRTIDKVATAILPTDRLYRADNAMRESLKGVDFSSYALIVGRYLRPTARAGVFDVENAPPILIDIDDRDDHSFEERLAEPELSLPMRFVLTRHIRAIRRIMPRLLGKAGHLWVANPEDAPLMRHHSVDFLPNIPFYQPDAAYDSAAAARSKTILYVGTSGYAPNYDGVVRFLEKCWPAIAAVHPDARFRIVGSDWDRLGALAETPGVELAGFCKDLAPEYEKAAFCVAPVYYGGGTKIKVIEALAFHRAVVATAHAAHGFPKEQLGDALTEARDDKEMIDACCALLNDAERRMSANALGDLLHNAGYSREAFSKTVLSACERALENA